jgi:hypothetical protein
MNSVTGDRDKAAREKVINGAQKRQRNRKMPSHVANEEGNSEEGGGGDKVSKAKQAQGRRGFIKL